MIEAVIAMRIYIAVAMHPAARHPGASGIVAGGPDEADAGAGGNVIVIDGHRSRMSDANRKCYLGLGRCASSGDDSGQCKSAKNAFHKSSSRVRVRTSFEASELFFRLRFFCSSGL